MVKYLDANRNIPMVRADMLLIDENAEVISESQEYNYPKMFINNCVGACFMYRRSVAQQVGQYDETLFVWKTMIIGFELWNNMERSEI